MGLGTLSQMLEYDHEQVVFCQNNEVGLKAIIAIHNTALGPALGGTRMWHYKTEQEALEDVLRLSHGMTYKAAVAGLRLGGGKAVIIGDPKHDKKPGFFEAYGRFVDTLAGRYITAEDVGTTVSDMEAVRSQTTAVVGTNRDHGGSGDPSPYTARGVYLGIKAAVKKTFSSDSLAGKHVAIKGVGNVGRNLTELLLKEDAQVTIADIDLEKVKMVQAKHPEVKVVTDEQIMEIECDVFSPCALGGGINDKTIASFKCPIIAGGANNQLAGPEHAHVLREKGILYVPDYVINAGGLINVSLEITGYDEKKSLELVDDIYFKVLKIFELADKKNISTAKAADQLVEEMLHIEPTKRIHVAQSATVGS